MRLSNDLLTPFLVAFSKIIEKIMYKRLTELLDDDAVMNKSQYSFLNNKSTEMDLWFY